jgi:hypothetical protein
MTTGCKKCGCQDFVERDHIASNGGKHIGMYCAKCNSWLKWMPQENVPSPEFAMPIGKYRGRTLIDIWEHDPDYLRWMSCADDEIDPKYKHNSGIPARVGLFVEHMES